MADHTAEIARLEAARHLHRPRLEEGVAWACSEGECDHDQCHNGDEFVTSDFKVCGHCTELADMSGLLEEFWPSWVMWPCKTAEALYEQPRLVLPDPVTPPDQTVCEREYGGRHYFSIDGSCQRCGVSSSPDGTRDG